MQQPFNPNEHLMQIKLGQTSKDYLPVQWRLVWFRSLCPEGTIETELVHLDLDRETEEEVFVWNNEKRKGDQKGQWHRRLPCGREGRQGRGCYRHRL
jgi:hypothetical protein